MTHAILQCRKCKYISADRIASKSECKRLLVQERFICSKCESKQIKIMETVNATPPENFNNAWIARQYEKNNGK